MSHHGDPHYCVIPAKAGIQEVPQAPTIGSLARTDWNPAFAGMTVN
jgi:hypothetical protein